MKYAVVEIKGRQYMVRPSQLIEVDRLEAKEGETINLDKVLLVGDEGEKVSLGKPYLNDVVVKAKVKTQKKGKKIRVATFKAKSRSRRVLGFRARLTELKIVKIVVKKASESKAKN
ncbi:50S ribosomal protein L21 [Patescibacteria group bacterium]|nr:50S ribosomal protein L21 [Patescibacteria group bacterium]